jgi:hypothetical protein
MFQARHGMVKVKFQIGIDSGPIVAGIIVLLTAPHTHARTPTKPAIQITAWAACDGLKTHCNQLATGTGNVSPYLVTR